MRGTLLPWVCASLVALPLAAAVVDGPVGYNAEKGDPARWYEPADTPQKAYRTLMKEAQAALAEARRECRAAPGDRKGCEAAARAQYERDVTYAREMTGREAVRR